MITNNFDYPGMLSNFVITNYVKNCLVGSVNITYPRYTNNSAVGSQCATSEELLQAYTR